MSYLKKLFKFFDHLKISIQDFSKFLLPNNLIGNHWKINRPNKMIHCSFCINNPIKKVQYLCIFNLEIQLSYIFQSLVKNRVCLYIYSLFSQYFTLIYP